MRIGILEAGRPPDELIEAHGNYVAMIARLIGGDAEFAAYPVREGRLPDSARAEAAWIVTGSRAAVYQRTAWIESLESFIRDVLAAEVPLVGLCFGHQAMASAVGAKVEKSPQGWGVGAHAYEVVHRPSWMAGDEAAFTINAMHEDQVAELPEGAVLLARSEFCPVAAMALRARAISFQGHPEFPNAYERDLIRLRRGTLIPERCADAALASLGPGAVARDAPLVASWLRRFLGLDSG